MEEKDRTKEQLENELVAMRQRITELETILEKDAQLYAQAQQGITGRKQTRERLLAAERAQARQQAALFRLSADLAAALEETEVCRRVVDGLHDTLGYDHLVLWLVDETSGDRVLVASVGFVEPPTRIPPGRGLSERPLLDGQLHYTPDVTQDPRYIPGMGGAEVDVPVRIGGKVLGVLIAESKQPHAFSEDDFEVLTAAAQQTGLAIEKARLLAAERQRADELDALRTTMADITAELELSALLQAIVERAAGLLDATGGELGLYDEASQEVRIVISHNLGEGYVGTRHALGEGAMGRVAETGEPLIIEDYQTWEGRAPQYADIRVHASLNAPLEVSGRLVGVISIAAADPARQFGPADLHLLSLFAQQAAIAIENARLYEGARQRAEELGAINEIAQTVTSSLDLDKVIHSVMKGINRILRVETGSLLLVDEETNELVFKITLQGDTEKLAPYRLKMGQGIAGWVAQRGEPLLVPDVQLDPRHYRAIDETIGFTSRSILCVPLTVKEKVIGVIEVINKLGRTSPDSEARLNENDLKLLSSMAAPVAIAIENARLYDQAQREITERVRAEAQLRKYQEHLEELVGERTAELRESEERYRTLFDGVPVGLYRTTPAGQFMDANLAMVQMLSYPDRETLLVTNAADLYMNPQDRVQWQASMQREGVVRDFEVQNRRYDGTVIWLNDTARALKDEQGEVLYYEGSVEDITERKRAEAELRKYQEHLEELVEERTAELRKSEERYRTLFDGVPVGLYRTTPTGQILDVNLAAVQMFGYLSREDTLSAVNTADVYVDPEERVRWQALMEREGVVRDFEEQVRRYDGTVIWLNDTARAVKDEQGQVLYYEGSLEDITERKKFEEEIRRQKDYFEALFVNSPVAVVTADLKGNVVSWNPIAERLFGYTQEEVIGRNLDDLVANDDSIRAEAAGYSYEVVNAGRVQATTKRTRKDGSLVDVELLALPVIVAGDKVGTICIYVDIADLQEARRQAEAANQAKSVFLANMSHELRTPLNAILGFTQLMDRDPNLTAAQRENVEIINRSGEHLLALINEVLEMSKIEAGRVTLEEKSFDLYRLLDGLEEMFGLRAKDKGLALSFERAENVPQYVRTDEGKLRQVLSNLLGNAVKFTQEGGVALRVGTKEEEPVLSLSKGRRTKEQPSSAVRRSSLVFEVEDTGPGIAPEELAVVFDPFVQATSGQEPQEGTGLGLSISRQYVRLMGGDIVVSSELGQGSLFKFDVRVGLADAAEVQAAQPTRRVLELEPNQPIYRLLVAEDKETNRQLLVKLLEPLGFEVKEAVNGQEAIEIWERWEPHLIWLDMRMPVMNGYEATRRIKATAKGQATVIIALTATAFEEDRERILSEGCDDFVRKPFRQDEIYDKLAKHLGVRFIYEEQAPLATVQPADAVAPLADVLTPVALAALPTGWVDDLRQATIKADLSLILALIDQIHGQSPALADALADLARNFEYKKILTLIEQAGG